MNDRLRAVGVLPDATIRQAMATIDSAGCEIALVLEPDFRLLGTVTDGDVRRALLRGAGLDDPVAPHMHRRFVSLSERASRAEALDLMRARSLRQIPVLDDQGRVVGLHLLRELIGAVERPTWAVVMAGGKGTRLLPLTEHVPKPLLQVAGRPILERIVLHLVGFGIRRIFLAVHYKADLIRAHFGDGAALGCRIEYLEEETPLGTGGALSLLPEPPSHPVLVLNGDLLTGVDVAAMLARFDIGAHRLLLGVHEYVHTVPFGVVEVEGERITALTEKPSASWLANAGIYVLDPAVIARMPRGREVPMTELVDDCLARGESVGAFHIKDDWLDVGRHDELRRARGEEPKP